MVKSVSNEMLESLNINWSTREQRSEFVATFAKQMGVSNVLNVGSGGERALSKFLDKNISHTDLDFVGDVDLKLNLDETERLPFDDNSFDLVCAMDVLEHLENFHRTNNELLRISKKATLISLPNSAAEVPYILFNKIKASDHKNRGVFSKYYGLPITHQTDRHRYWMYTQDIIRFYENFAKAENIHCLILTPKLGFKKRLAKIFFGERIFSTFFVTHLCIVLQKNNV